MDKIKEDRMNELPEASKRMMILSSSMDSCSHQAPPSRPLATSGYS